MENRRAASLCTVALLASLLLACAHHPAEANDATSAGSSGGHESRRVIVEKVPGGTKTTVITTRSVEAPPPPARPADPIPDDALVRYNLDLLNEYRAHAGVKPLLYDAKISAFALAGSRELSHDHEPHAHFRAHAEGAPGFGSRAAENQGDPSGVPPLAPDRVASGKKQIAVMLKMMFDEGPGGGHHDNMLNPKYRRVGIGIHEPGGTLFLTNDFSD